MIKPMLGSILFFCVCLFTFSVINWLGQNFLTWFSSQLLVKQIAVFTLLCSVIWLLFIGLREVLMNLSSKLSVRLVFGIFAISLFSVINGTHLIYNSFLISGSYSGRQILPSIFLLILILETTIAPILDLPGALKSFLKTKTQHELTSRDCEETFDFPQSDK